MTKNSTKTAVCFVADFKYLYKNFPRIHKQLTNVGKYKGEIVLVTSIFSPTFLISEIRNNKRIKVMRFKKIKFKKSAELSLKTLSSFPNRHTTKRFQWQKFNLFKYEMKKWDYLFYLDINMTIHHDINLILDQKPIKKLYARSDGYPDYTRILKSQFDDKKEKFEDLNKNFNLQDKYYFQTGVLFFDTGIIEKTTFKDLIDLTNKYPISITNEQGIFNIYFKFLKKSYEELPIIIENFISYYYWNSKNKNIIITKSLHEKFK